jgi:hypothetical protein
MLSFFLRSLFVMGVAAVVALVATFDAAIIYLLLVLIGVTAPFSTLFGVFLAFRTVWAVFRIATSAQGRTLRVLWKATEKTESAEAFEEYIKTELDKKSGV